MKCTLSPGEKKAIDSILNEAENMFMPQTSVQDVSLQALDEQSKQLWGEDWDQSITIKQNYSTPKEIEQKPFSQLIRERNPEKFQMNDFEVDSDVENETEAKTTTLFSPKMYSSSENDSDSPKKSDFDEDEEKSSDDDKSSYFSAYSKESASKKHNEDIEKRVLRKANKSKLLMEYRNESKHEKKEKKRIADNQESYKERPKKSSIRNSAMSSSSSIKKKKVPSLYQRSLKKEYGAESAYDKYDIVKLRQDNIEAKNTIARLQAALDKANMENEKLKKDLQHSESIRKKQKSQISYILSESKL